MILTRNLQDRPVLASAALARIAAVVDNRLGASEAGAGVAFVDDTEMSFLHGRFMDDPSTTDVLSFPAEEAEYWGDVVVCTDQARRQARELRHPYPYELAVLVLHGLLHLRGYDHVVDGGEMRRLEEALRPRCAAGGVLR